MHATDAARQVKRHLMQESIGLLFVHSCNRLDRSLSHGVLCVSDSRRTQVCFLFIASWAQNLQCICLGCCTKRPEPYAWITFCPGMLCPLLCTGGMKSSVSREAITNLRSIWMHSLSVAFLFAHFLLFILSHEFLVVVGITARSPGERYHAGKRVDRRYPIPWSDASYDGDKIAKRSGRYETGKEKK